MSVVTDQSTQPFGHDLQQLVAGWVAECIVDGLELVEIEMMNGNHFAVPESGERTFQPLIEQYPIGEIGQRIVVSHMRDLDLGLALLGDIFVGGDPAEVG